MESCEHVKIFWKSFFVGVKTGQYHMGDGRFSLLVIFVLGEARCLTALLLFSNI